MQQLWPHQKFQAHFFLAIASWEDVELFFDVCLHSSLSFSFFRRDAFLFHKWRKVTCVSDASHEGSNESMAQVMHPFYFVLSNGAISIWRCSHCSEVNDIQYFIKILELLINGSKLIWYHKSKTIDFDPSLLTQRGSSSKDEFFIWRFVLKFVTG